MWERKEDSTSEEARKKEVAKEDKRNRKRSPIRNMRNRKHNEGNGTKEDAQTTIVKKTGDTEDTMNNTILDHTNMERGISQKMSPRKNGKLLNARTTKRKDKTIG